MFTRLSVALAMLACAWPAAAEVTLLQQAQAVQSGTVQYVLRSGGSGRDYLVEVTTPPGEYAAGTKLPVIVALDGGFGVVGPASTLLIAGGMMAPAIVVSVGYTNPIASNLGARNTDLVHARLTTPQGQAFGGGGAAFETFLVDELRPFLEARHAIDPSQYYLVGHSGGGLFAATVLIEHPERFAGYVVGGMPVTMQPDIVDRARAAAANGGGRKVFVFYTPQDREANRSDLYSDSISGPNSRLEVRKRVYEDQRHLSSYLSFIPDALPFLLPPRAPPAPAPAAAPAAIPDKDRFVGVYRIGPGATLAVVPQGDRLMALMTGNSPIPLAAAGPGRLESRGAAARINLVFPDRAGPPDRVDLIVRGVAMTGRRVDEPLPPIIMGPPR